MDFEPATLLSTRKVAKTRKSHQCFGCLRRFPKGSKLTCDNLVCDGEAYSLYYCEACKNRLKEYMESYNEEREIGWGDLGFWKGDQWYPKKEEDF